MYLKFAKRVNHKCSHHKKNKVTYEVMDTLITLIVVFHNVYVYQITKMHILNIYNF